jgi:hydrogenase-4 component F
MSPLHAVLLPLVFAALAFAVPSNRLRPLVLPLCGTAQLALVLALLPHEGAQALDGWLVLDALGGLVLLTVALLFFFCSLYAPAYLRLRADRQNRVYCGGLCAVVGMLSAVALAHHLGLLWVALEATTLASAPLLYFNQTKSSLEAAWKYLLICSVGIALALLGTFFLAYAALDAEGSSTLLLGELVARGEGLSRPWLHAAFAALLVGYGTKMGLAPMHTWKPDAYGEAAGVLGAVLAGGITSGAFVALLRVLAVTEAAGDSGFTRPILIGMGLCSMLFAAVFMTRQRDTKRLLAWSSVEHMGILVLGVGVGGLGAFGALLHMLNNALGKGVLFLAAGNMHRAFGSKRVDVMRGALRRVPVTAALYLAGFLAITGSPPFGPFVSMFTVARAAFDTGHLFAAVAYLVLLMAAFLGMGVTVLAVVFGEPPAEREVVARHADAPALVLPILGLVLLVLLLGLWLPEPLRELLQRAAALVEVGR